MRTWHRPEAQTHRRCKAAPAHLLRRRQGVHHRPCLVCARQLGLHHPAAAVAQLQAVALAQAERLGGVPRLLGRQTQHGACARAAQAGGHVKPRRALRRRLCRARAMDASKDDVGT